MTKKILKWTWIPRVYLPAAGTADGLCGGFTTNPSTATGSSPFHAVNTSSLSEVQRLVHDQPSSPSLILTSFSCHLFNKHPSSKGSQVWPLVPQHHTAHSSAGDSWSPHVVGRSLVLKSRFLFSRLKSSIWPVLWSSHAAWWLESLGKY